MRYLIFDTETTGFSPESGDRIVEIAFVEMINEKITEKHFHTLVNPERSIPEQSSFVHGIKDEDVKDAPVFKDIAKNILDFIGDATLIAHNAQFDMNFINYQLQACGFEPLGKNRFIDTMKIAQEKFSNQRNSLDHLCLRFNINTESRKEYHGALVDSYLLAEVYLNLINKNLIEFMGDKDKLGEGSLLNRKISFPKRDFPISAQQIQKHREFIQANLKNSKWY